MISLSDIPDLVRDYESTELLWSAAYPSLLHLLGDHEVGEVVKALSPELALRFEAELVEEFSDESLAEHGLWIDSAGGEPPNRRQIVDKARAWLQRAGVTAPAKKL
jgi:hypothetical protein